MFANYFRYESGQTVGAIKQSADWSKLGEQVRPFELPAVEPRIPKPEMATVHHDTQDGGKPQTVTVTQ